uniref:PX domain containing serine/threonine kinase n=1 Tax=Oryzias sinensis TaxID=183150 RepID=A0A8C8DX39_9TELE
MFVVAHFVYCWTHFLFRYFQHYCTCPMIYSDQKCDLKSGPDFNPTIDPIKIFCALTVQFLCVQLLRLSDQVFPCQTICCCISGFKCLVRALRERTSPVSQSQYSSQIVIVLLLFTCPQVCGISLPLPPKKLIGNMDREFIAERQRGLQTYLDSITQHPLLSNSLTVKKFLDPSNYSANYTEIALQQVSMFFRSDPKWEVLEPLRDMGWRIRKKYFLVKNKELPKEKYLLSWVSGTAAAPLGPPMFGQYSTSCLPQTPYLCPLVFSNLSESSALLIRPFSESGCLRDHICKVKPRDSYLKKYCNPKRSQGLELEQIKLYGRQILEGLKLLHDNGMFFGHLHTSNVMVEDDVCQLLEVENGILGVPSMLRATFSQLRKINTTESIDVFCFGHSLYEMTYGRPPDSVPVDQFPAGPHTSVVSVLESILSSEACKSGMPSVSALIQTPLFIDVRLKQSEKLQIKVPSKLKEALRAAKEKLEKRLQEEQKLLHHHRRLTRAQSHHSSEEEKKRRKILARKKSRQTNVEHKEDISVPNSNNSGR